MSKPRIAIILGTTRATRFGEKPALWIRSIANERAQKRNDIEVEIVDLRDYPMPFFDEPASNAWMPSKNEVAQRWQKKVASFDGYIFVTAGFGERLSTKGLPLQLPPVLGGIALALLALPLIWNAFRLATARQVKY